MSFVKFTMKKIRVGKPQITINEKGMFYFNAAMMDTHIKEKRNVIYHYDEQYRKIGFSFLAERQEISYRIQRQNNRGSASASAKPFLNYHRINYTVKQTFDVEYDTRNKLYVIDLKEPIKK